MATVSRPDVYATVTNKIVEMLENGVRPWMQPWQAAHSAGSVSRPLRQNGQRYQGINVLVLWIESEVKGFLNPHWMTFQQCKELGGHVKKGERGTQVVYANTFKAKEENDKGEEVEREIPYLKQYTVFNVDQCNGLPDKFGHAITPTLNSFERIEQADAFFANTKADIQNGGSRAFYSPVDDRIHMPPVEIFNDAESYAATLSHELAHWTKHEKRLNRDCGRKSWGDAGYAMEELVAELTSAFLCADLSITPEIREDHASYLASWLRVLKNDKKAIFTAASMATKAVEYLHKLQPQAVTELQSA